MDSILPPHLQNKGSTLRKDLPPKPKFGRKNAQSDSVIFFSLSFFPYVFALLICFAFLFLSQSSFMLYVFLYVFVWLFFSFFFLFIKINK